MKRTTASTIAILVISLGIWTAYSLTPYPLDAPGTVVVVGVVGAIVFGIQWLVRKRRARTADGGQETKHE